MKKVGITDLPLHTGKAPRWLFERMKKLASEVLYIIAIEHGTDKILENLSDPFWFQAFGCLLGFDWHSSGITTTVMGAIKEGLKAHPELKIFVAGGKGKASLKTPEEISQICDKFGIDFGKKFIRLSRLTAKIDNNALQDGFGLYHHTFVFTERGSWAVIQQGMDPQRLIARRYHWLSQKIKKMTIEPHTAICCDEKRKTLNLIDAESEKLQEAMVELSQNKPDAVAGELKMLKLTLPKRHHISLEDINIKRFKAVMERAQETNISNFENLILLKGAGAKFLRALALTAEIIYGTKLSFKDPARFAFAHGGKDGHPYPVNRMVYDNTIETLKEIINKAKIGEIEKMKALKRLSGVERSDI